MNKHIFGIAAACVALAACSKNEVKVNVPDQEITFQTVGTKAASPFNTSNKFCSYAYFLEKGNSWDANYNSANAYISNAAISYNTTANAWKATDTYYWPKQGSLTFFAWTDNTPDPKIEGTDASITCGSDTGIKISNYSVTDNKNRDILVADIAKDQTANTTTTSTWKKGVPTVFKHALSNVEFKVNKTTSYDGVTFKVKSITLNNVNTKGTYTQGSPSANTISTMWTSQDVPTNLSVFNGEVEVTKTKEGTEEWDELTASTGDYKIVLPQKFTSDDQVLTIVYDINTNYTGTVVTETVTDTKKLSEIYHENWESGKKYILSITLGLNEIYWAPSVEDWTSGDVTNITF